jgi:hypothetical protein
VIDEGGEDYAFTANRVHLLTLPRPVEQTPLSAEGTVMRQQETSLVTDFSSQAER